MKTIDLEGLFDWDQEAREKKKQKNEEKRKAKLAAKGHVIEAVEDIPEEKDKTQDKLDLALENNPEETIGGLVDNWKPYSLADYATPKFEVPVKNSNNYEVYKKQELSKVLAFIEYAQRKRLKEGCTAMPIPTTSQRNLMIWGYPKAISRAIKFMKDTGLIQVYIDTYRFAAPFAGANYGKTYAYFAENEKKLIQYCEEHGIHKFVIKNLEEIRGTKKQIEKIESALDLIDRTRTFEISAVRFAKGLELEKPNGVSDQDFVLYLYACLYLNYPELAFHQAKADEINERFYEDYPEFKLRFRPHFTWKDNKVVKIGIRLSNEFCNKKKAERQVLLDQYGFHLAHDVRSSVPRLTLSINEGQWIDESIDIYELINKEFEPNTEFSEARRDALKHYMLRTYFDMGTKKELGRNVLSIINEMKVKRPGVKKEDVDELIGNLKNAAFKALGSKTYGSDIFYIESCIYLMTLYDLLTSGHMVWLVYDAFYANGAEDKDTFEEMVKNSVKINFNYFMEHSIFNENFKKVRAVENKTGLLVKEIIKKYCIKV